MLIDLRVNGWPRRVDWQFSLRTLMLGVIAFAIFSLGMKALWEIWHLPPANY